MIRYSKVFKQSCKLHKKLIESLQDFILFTDNYNEETYTLKLK